MRFMYLVIGLLAAFALPSAARAQDIDCAVAEVQSDLNDCAYLEWDRLDKELSQVLTQAMEVLAAIDADLAENERSAVTGMTAAQAAWLTFRDESCKAESALMYGGSAQAMLLFGCKARLTKARRDDLQLIIDAAG